ncbi:MAG: PD-(D/E)XK nuclease family protein, partial [bacterium]|nr:PD-(D/E)XK nuclease family protein [bacterium]
QAGLYLLAVRECFGAEPAGMLFCAVSRGPKWAGWHTLPELGDVVEPADPDLIEALGETARTVSLDVAERIRSGEIATAPADTNKCSYCSHHDICRVETPSIARAGGGGE